MFNSFLISTHSRVSTNSFLHKKRFYEFLNCAKGPISTHYSDLRINTNISNHHLPCGI